MRHYMLFVNYNCSFRFVPVAVLKPLHARKTCRSRPKLRRMQNISVNLATASARKMKLRNSLFHMMLCSAATLHLAVDAKISPSNRVALPGPSGKTTTVQGRQRPQFKAPPEHGGMLTEASAGAPVAAHVTGNGELATAPPTITAKLPAFKWGRCSSHDHPSMQCRTTAKTPRAGSRTRGPRFSTQSLANVTTSPGGAHKRRPQYIYPCIAV